MALQRVCLMNSFRVKSAYGNHNVKKVSAIFLIGKKPEQKADRSMMSVYGLRGATE
jgi:hypothetical protein